MRGRRSVVVAALSVGLALTLSSCSDLPVPGLGDDDEGHVVYVTITPTPADEPAEEQPEEQARATTAAPPEPRPDCGENPDARAITAAIPRVPEPSLDGLHWVYDGDSNYDPCLDLSYATVLQSEMGNSQFQNQLMLFHRGEYLGVGTLTVQQHSVVGTTDDSVTVRYKDYEALEAAGAPNAMSNNYTTDVTYRWNGERVVPEGRIPNQR